MSVQLHPKESTMDDNVVSLRSSVMAKDGHISSKQEGLREPSVCGLPCEISVRFES